MDSPDKDWIKITVNASKRDDLRLTTIGCIIKDSDESFQNTAEGFELSSVGS